MFDEKLLERFWNKVRKPSARFGADGKYPTECWEWIAAKRSRKTGYGAFRVHEETIDTHRVSWMIHFGEIPDDKCVLHRCDNRICIRPDHLFLGTKLDNVRDMISKGRQYIMPGGREKPISHGTISEYKSHKCRCGLCKEAQKQHQRKWRLQQKQHAI